MMLGLVAACPLPPPTFSCVLCIGLNLGRKKSERWLYVFIVLKTNQPSLPVVTSEPKASAKSPSAGGQVAYPYLCWPTRGVAHSQRHSRWPPTLPG